VRQYLEALIVEQINRAVILKGLIDQPLKSPYLGQLSERCNNILDDQVGLLNHLRSELGAQNTDLRWIHRKVRMAITNISVVEYYGISSLRYQTDEVDFLNGLVFKITQEISLPTNPPSVSCLSNNYFYFEPVTRVIYVPLAEADFLLHLPDLYHEIGHSILISSAESFVVTKLRVIAKAEEDIASAVTQHFRSLIQEESRNLGPKEIPLILARIHANWKSWLNEFLSDLFAILTLGPAFAWSHLHLVAKISDNVYQGSWLSNESHPANEARMRLMLLSLQLVGFENEADSIKTRWLQLTKTLDSPDAYYWQAYPDSLLSTIAKTFLEALEKAGISIVSQESISRDKPVGSIRTILSEAWEAFWSMKPEEYREWETMQIANLKKLIQLPQRMSAFSPS